MKAGIDLGTTNSLIARLNPDGSPDIIPDITFQEYDYTPSAIFLGEGTAMVGLSAETKLTQDPNANIIRFFKRSFGEITPLCKDNAGNDWYPESLAALVLKKLVHDYEGLVGENLQDVVITVPAHFNAVQRNSVVYAANMANIQLKGILEEPYAAALHYGVQVAPETESVLFVYDFGGGTFDASVISLTSQSFEVLSKGGHTEIGGKELDEAIMEKIMQAIPQNSIEWNAFNLLHLRKIAEAIKKELSDEKIFFLKKLIVIGNWTGTIVFNRTEFEQQIKEKILQTIAISERCIQEAGLVPENIDAFLLVGGSSQVPLVRQLLAETLNIPKEKIKLDHPMRAIVYGAALHNAQLSGDFMNNRLPPEFKGVTGYCIGVKTHNAQTNKLEIDTLIHKNYPLPQKASRVYYTRNDQQTTITLELVQYLNDSTESASIGVVEVGPILQPRTNYMVDVSIEYTLNGTIIVSAYDPQTGQEIAQSFSNHPQQSVLMLQQQELVRKTIVNNIA